MALTHSKKSTYESVDSPLPTHQLSHAFITRINRDGIRIYRAVPALPTSEQPSYRRIPYGVKHFRADYDRLSDSKDTNLGSGRGPDPISPEMQWSRFRLREVMYEDGKPISKWPTWDRAKTTVFKKEGLDPWKRWSSGVPDKVKRHDYDATMRARYTFMPIPDTYYGWYKQERELEVKPLQAGYPGKPNKRSVARKVDTFESCIEEGEDVARDRRMKVEPVADQVHQPRAHDEPVLCSAEDKEVSELYKKGILYDDKPNDEITLADIQHKEPTYSIRVKPDKRRGKSRSKSPRKEEQELFLDGSLGSVEEITDEMDQEEVMSLYKEVMEQMKADNPEIGDDFDFVVVVGDGEKDDEEVASVTETWSVIGAEG